MVLLLICLLMSIMNCLYLFHITSCNIKNMVCVHHKVQTEMSDDEMSKYADVIITNIFLLCYFESTNC
jgi:hypothetical protein